MIEVTREELKELEEKERKGEIRLRAIVWILGTPYVEIENYGNSTTFSVSEAIAKAVNSSVPVKA